MTATGGHRPDPPADASGPLVVGVDAGGTSTRCLVVGVDGRVVGTGSAGGANQWSSGTDPAASIATALAGGMDGLDTRRVVAGVVGVTGAGAAGRSRAREAVRTAWQTVGLPGQPEVETDIVIAYAAGTRAASGLVLIAGTGAVAATVRDWTIGGRCDGYGWLLGDEGSAVWLGRAAGRAVLADLDGRGPRTRLTAEVLGAALDARPPEAGACSPGARSPEPGTHATGPHGAGTPDPDGTDADKREELAQALVRWAHTRPPAELGALAPLVDTAARDGDEVAWRIVEDAAERLLVSLTAAGRDLPGDADVPVVLAGSVLHPGTAVHRLVSERVRARYGHQPRVAGAAAAGAAALALHRLLPPASAAAAHETLLRSAAVPAAVPPAVRAATR